MPEADVVSPSVNAIEKHLPSESPFSFTDLTRGLSGSCEEMSVSAGWFWAQKSPRYAGMNCIKKGKS
ncbi:hypothetical protein Pvag_1465 [Pantoea vagans C9-1]|nr:hypothetical protein Pvag_1465 [Pantoea vagans C9-1]